jgi:hypothetical protein
MQSGKKPVNCMPCAKRKVRCDRSQPCYHCKRRKGDVCVYPTQRTSDVRNQLENANERIEKLETYIRRLGGDPKLLEQMATDDGANVQQLHTSPNGTESRRAEELPSVVRYKTNASRVEKIQRLLGKKQGLVEHDEQITYTELCVRLLYQPISR